MNNKPNRPIIQRKPSRAECKRDWSTGSTNSPRGKGRRIVAHNQLIFTVLGPITGSVTAGNLVSGHHGLRVFKLPSGNWCQVGFSV
jgi:hypothetical protein